MTGKRACDRMENAGWRQRLVLLLVFGVIFWLALGGAGLARAEGLGAAAAPGAGAVTGDPFEDAIIAAVVEAVQGQARELAPQVQSLVMAEIDLLEPEIKAIIRSQQEQFHGLTPKQPDLSGIMAQLPPANYLAMIPPEFVERTKALALERTREGIVSQFAPIIPGIQEQLAPALEALAPQIQERIKPSIQAVIPQVHALIESRLETAIESKILETLPGIMPLIPREMANLSPEEIAVTYGSKLQPKMEGVIRSLLEVEIQDTTKEAVMKRLNAMEEQIQPRLDDLQSTVVDQTMAQIPAHVEELVPRSFILSVVQEQVRALQSQLPEIIQSQTGEMRKKMDEFVEEEIRKYPKVYLGDKRINFDVNPQNRNGRLLVPFRAIAETLGAQVGWNNALRQVAMKKDDQEVVLTLDSDTVLVNGNAATIDVPATVVEGRTLVPLRFISETFGVKIDWQPDWKMVTLTQ